MLQEYALHFCDRYSPVAINSRSRADNVPLLLLQYVNLPAQSNDVVIGVAGIFRLFVSITID